MKDGTRVYVGKRGARIWHAVDRRGRTLCQCPIPKNAIFTKALDAGERLCFNCETLAAQRDGTHPPAEVRDMDAHLKAIQTEA